VLLSFEFHHASVDSSKSEMCWAPSLKEIEHTHWERQTFGDTTKRSHPNTNIKMNSKHVTRTITFLNSSDAFLIGSNGREDAR
jgi:hypothetical protein